MKKFYLFFFSLFVCVTSVYSQLQVDSIGYVGIGVTEEILEDEEADSIMSPFSVCTAGDEEVVASFKNTDRLYTIDVQNTRTGDASGYGVYSTCNTRKGNSFGILGIATTNNPTNSNTTNTVIGIRGVCHGGYSSDGVGVCGGKYLMGTEFSNFAGIYGSSNSGLPVFLHSGIYAGYFDGQVRATGPMYAQAFYVPSASPTGGGDYENTSFTTIGERGSVIEKLRNVSSFELQHSEQPTQTRSNSAEEFLGGRDIQQLTKKELHQLDSICNNAPTVESDPLACVNYGLDAEQLKAMFPKLVQQDKEGNYSINYVEMIPLLVQSINEMSEKIETLEQQLGDQNKTRKAKAETTGIEDTKDEVDIVRMDQNKPNPFSESTVIGLYIPEKTQTAKIFIYDLSGKQVKSIPVTERGETNITVYASDLGAGMYIYTLVIDGKVVVTRRMIVSKDRI